VAVNAGGLPEGTFESEIFGHVKGAFTDARTDRIGRFELANGGTLFLDEIANVPLRQQAKLLRVLETGELERVGSSQTRRVDVRILSATNARLDEEAKAGNFREDLLFRINTVEIHLPALRDRREDIPLLAMHFLGRNRTRYRKQVNGFSPAAMQQMMQYPWPGNVRELRNMIERIVILNPQVRVDARHIPLNVSRRPAERPMDRFGSLAEVREAVEREYILKKLEETNGNVTRTAELLGLERSNLYRKMKTLGIGPKE
jgi:two-component system nitrogen regulation response regulator NtrX